MSTPIRWEDAAEYRTNIAGWCCKKCGHYWGEGPSGERAARYCCGRDDAPCATEGCPNRSEFSGTTICASCRSRRTVERWEKTAKVDWDGETPLCEWDGDRYFFDGGTLRDHIADRLSDGMTIEDMQFVLCEPNKGRGFDIEDYLSDDLPDDDHGGSPLRAADVAEINKTVNDWIEKHAPYSWEGTGSAVNPASLPMPEPEGE